MLTHDQLKDTIVHQAWRSTIEHQLMGQQQAQIQHLSLRLKQQEEAQAIADAAESARRQANPGAPGAIADVPPAPPAPVEQVEPPDVVPASGEPVA
jgi:hypothetical protein